MGLTRRRKLKNAIIRSRLPGKPTLATAYLRGVERYRSIGGAHGGTALDGLPLPPSRLRVLVAGTADVGHFLNTGKAHSEYLRELLGGVSQPLEEMSAILDFGCGCGRIGRWFSDLTRTHFDACDYNGELVAWCDANLPFLHARKTELEPPLPYPSQNFDFLYAFSVFTHLSVELAQCWMAELRRIIRPGGLMWFTIHGESYRERLLPEEKLRFDAGEIIVWLPEIAGTNLCAAYWSNAAVADLLGHDFEILEHFDPKADAGMAQRRFLEHDAYLVRRV